MGIGPVFAVPRLLERHGLEVDDIDLWELNEAFAVQVALLPRPARHRSARRSTSMAARSPSAIPYGMSGARLVRPRPDRGQAARRAQYAVVTMCVGGGMGCAGLFEIN